MSEHETASNLAARVLFEAALSADLVTSRTTLEAIPSIPAEGIRVWATQRGVSLDSLDDQGAVLTFGERAIYCFRFGTEDNYNGVVCVDADGTLLAEDSRVSVWPSN